MSSEPTALDLHEHTAVAFQINGDVQGVLLLLFDFGLDSDMYAEVGNVIASRFVAQLDAVISPPKTLNHSQLERLMRSQKPLLRASYLHHYEKTVVPLTVLLLGNVLSVTSARQATDQSKRSL